MAELRMSVEIVEFDLTHVRVKIAVLGERKTDGDEGHNTKRLYQSTASTLRMTLIELHIFLRALMEFKGPLEVTTPDLLRGVREEEGGDRSSFRGDEIFYESTEAAE